MKNKILIGFTNTIFIINLIFISTAYCNENKFWQLEKINIEDAWKITKGSEKVTVAVVDSGINLDSFEFEDRLVSKYNIENNNDDVNDSNGHGSHIAGIIGAADNGRGITGVAPNVNIMPVKINTYKLNIENIATGLEYACNNGADIINCSISMTPKTKNRYTFDFKNFKIIDKYEELYKESKIKEIIKDNPNKLFVFSAGNDKNSKANYPARYNLDNVISVAATDQNDKLWREKGFSKSGSNYGKEDVDIAAPGVDVLSTWSSGLEYQTGTSMSAAYVSGVCALLKSKYPEASAIDIKNAIIESARKIKSLENKVLSGGVLDANESLKALDKILKKKA